MENVKIELLKELQKMDPYQLRIVLGFAKQLNKQKEKIEPTA